jgi:hypothetical protein
MINVFLFSFHALFESQGSIMFGKDIFSIVFMHVFPYLDNLILLLI